MASSFLLAEEDPVSETVLLPELKGIVLSDHLVNLDDLSCYAGDVEFIELDIPGNPEYLKRSLSPFLTKEVTAHVLSEIQDIIATHYTASRHPFVVSSVPDQDVTNGVVQVVVQESHLGEVQVEGNRWSSTNRLRNYIRLRPGDPIDESRLIQSISFMNRSPFRRVDLVFAAGKKPQTTDVILSTKDRFPLRVYTGSDNTGVQPTGEGRWYTGFNWGNAFGLDHVLSYQFTSAWETHKFLAHTVEYLALLSWGHVLNIFGGYSEVHPHVNFPFRSNDGWNMQVSGRYVMPLKIFQFLEHEITVGGDFKRTNNTFAFTEIFPVVGKNVNLSQFVLGYSGNYERNNFRLDFKGNIYCSPAEWLADQSNSDYSSLRPGAVNRWIYFRGAFSYLQQLSSSNPFSLSFSMEGQVASNPLLPSEQFGLGGYNSVRGYEQNQVNEDNAIRASLELRSPGLPVFQLLSSPRKFSDALQFLAFIDYGWGINIETIPGGQKADFLVGAGPGVRYTLEPYLTGRLDWGIRLHNKQAFPGGASMFHFNLTASY